jgi:hypothetical protein
MPELNMKWFFQPDGDRTGARQDGEEDSGPGQISLSPELLERHGVRVLDPGRAAAVAGLPAPRPTVYRARTLLVPDHLLQDDALIEAINAVLARVGMELVPPEPSHDTADEDGAAEEYGEVFEALRELPRPAVLVPVEGDPTPVVINAWVALQALRAAARERPEPEEATVPEHRVLPRAVVEQISLEHVLIDSAITGSPAGHSGGIAAGPGSGGDVSGPTPTDSYLFSGGDPRTPVAVFSDPARRKTAGDSERAYGRRPVVAVLDSGIRAHPWLDVTPAPGGGYDTHPDGFVQIDNNIQAAIRAESEQAANHGDRPRQVIRDERDTPIAANPLIGELNPALGHSTFIAGIVRQVAPDAQVLAIRIMHSDDLLYEGDIICALRHLARRIALAEAGDLAAMVDVVSLSWGYFSESRHDEVVTSGLGRVIKVLLSLGVVVVAAAGNFASARRFYPAAFALEKAPDGGVPVISVGALNPNGTKAMFSNDGDWVTAFALGAAVVSTYPVDVDGSRTPELRIPVNRKPRGELPGREALDPDDYCGGHVQWSGTSFAAPCLAALITRSMLEEAERTGLRLDVSGKQAARDRAAAALDALRRQVDRDG